MRTPCAEIFVLAPFRFKSWLCDFPLETLFYEAGLELAGGDSSCVHFGYQSFAGGYPRFLPENFPNLVAFDVRAKDKKMMRWIATYVRKHDIRFVLIFDAQPVLPLFRSLPKCRRRFAILAYIGAPISSLMPPWKLMLKRMQVAMSRSKLDGMIFESRAMADLAVFGRGVPERMISIVPPGWIEKFHPLKSDYAYEAFGFPRERRIVIYSGHMELEREYMF